MVTEVGKVRDQGPRARDLKSQMLGWPPGGYFGRHNGEGGRAPLRGVGELRPLEVSRQPPDFFPGIRHHRLLAKPRKNSGHVNPKAAGACAKRAARRDKRLRP